MTTLFELSKHSQIYVHIQILSSTVYHYLICLLLFSSRESSDRYRVVFLSINLAYSLGLHCIRVIDLVCNASAATESDRGAGRRRETSANLSLNNLSICVCAPKRVTGYKPKETSWKCTHIVSYIECKS